MVGILTRGVIELQRERNTPLPLENARVVSLQPPVPCGGQPSRLVPAVPLGRRRLSLRCREKTRQKQLRREFAYIAAANQDLLDSPVRRCSSRPATRSSTALPTRRSSRCSLCCDARRPAESPRCSLALRMSTRAPRAVRSPPGERRTSWPWQDSTRRRLSRRTAALPSRPSPRPVPAEDPAGPASADQALQAGYIAYYRGLVARAPRDAVCLVDTGRSDNGASCGTTAAEIKDGMPPDDDNGVDDQRRARRRGLDHACLPCPRGKPARSADRTGERQCLCHPRRRPRAKPAASAVRDLALGSGPGDQDDPDADARPRARGMPSAGR